MNHLEQAKENLSIIANVAHSDMMLIQEAHAHALIDIAESLHRLIECQVQLVPIVGTIGDGKITMTGEGSDDGP